MAKAKHTALAIWLERARQFVEDLPAEGISPRPVTQKLRSALQFLWLVWRGFALNRCPVRAAALSYTTLLALVPLLAVVFSVSKNFLHDSSADLVPKLMDKMVSVVAPELGTASPEAQSETVEKIQSFIDNIQRWVQSVRRYWCL